MKSKIRAMLIISAGLLSARSAHGQNTTVVRADNAPVWGTNVRFVRDMRIGAVEGAEEYMFGSVSSLSVAPDGNIFVRARAKSVVAVPL